MENQCRTLLRILVYGILQLLLAISESWTLNDCDQDHHEDVHSLQLPHGPSCNTLFGCKIAYEWAL